ncbi:ATP-binding protein [Duganella sp. BuS-21]|uniref:ATP-binding protein n=1 Tax=Duganella sp. BuS-21 TaxID=2943848 RepID=UPI0035A5C192
MNAERHPAPLIGREQFRMHRLQVYNWGTFNGLHEVPISERGFLIVGRSGAGKSTLLDAFSALLVPPRWIDFNAAAREADRTGRDRNLVSYVRGAWAAQSDSSSGEYTTRYLRQGTSWSALALHYRNAQGQEVVLVQLFWLRGNANANTDVKRYFLILERPFDLREIGDFGSSNFDVRKLKQALPEAYARDEFRPYCERFCRLLGIDSEMALRLLHKTQSAKNLGDLNAFLRDFMLDKPETFTVAERLVDEFGELNAAHQAVVTARRQVQTLAPARSRHDDLRRLRNERGAVEELRVGMNSYRERLRMRLLAEQLAALEVDADGLAGQLQRQQDVLNNRTAVLRDLEARRRAAGGDQIEHLEGEKKTLGTQRDERLRRRKQATDACEKLGWTLRPDPQGFAALQGQARQEMDQWQANSGDNEPQLVLDRERTEVSGKLAAVTAELASLRRQPSNIPVAMLELRHSIAAAIGVADGALPFVGELVEVKPDEAAWRGAAERVLHGFALSILVDNDHYNALSQYLNDVNLGQRLVYYRTGSAGAGGNASRVMKTSSLAFKLNVKDAAHAGWLKAELQQRYDYDCVDSLRAFRAAPDRAMTCEGQIKHSKTRHEKDDRHSVDDRRYWVLGYDNRDKQALYRQQQEQLQQRLDQLNRELDSLRLQLQASGARIVACTTLVNLQWQEIDVLPPMDRIAAIDRQLQALKEGNNALQQIEQLLGQQTALVLSAESDVRDTDVQRRTVLGKIDESGRQLKALQADPSIVTPTPHQQQGLDRLYAELADKVTLAKVDQADRAIGKILSAQAEALNTDIQRCERDIEAAFAVFIREWKADSDGLDATLAAASDFFAKLARLETDGLPAHEHRFFELLHNQSHQNLAALSTYLNDGRKAILERMELVNASLRQVAFNQTADLSTYLYIQPSDRQLPEVRAFKQDIQNALSNAWNEDRESAESRFIALRRLVDDLASQEPDKRRWREAVLDVRLHVEFIGREIDTDGNEVEVYQSGAGKSGGQRQKLATTCLAAALRYQLGGSDHALPVYAPVVLDEAFDKADNEFTALAMNIFANFGFQMIVATPLKSVMTLEPFIGGACFVDIRDRKISGVLMIEYDDERQRLKLPEQAHLEAALEAAK